VESVLIKNILVPIDGSEHSNNALKFALDLAEKYSAKLTLISVAQPVVVTGPMFITQPMMPPTSTAMYVQAIESAHKKMLEETYKKVKTEKPDLEISKKLIDGRPADRIVEIADKENFDLIVMGSRGVGGVKKFFLGSVSDRVADEAHCPVLIVK
jgi:nucleotide-binding universal stress UspA family protein